MIIKTSKALFLALSLATLTVGISSAAQASEEKAEHEAEEEAEHDHGHGHVTLHEIIAGEEALQFWGAVVNFALLIVVIRRLAKKPLNGFLEGRRNGIERGIMEAAEVKRAAEAAFTAYNDRMKTLDSELAKLRKDVADAAERDRQRIVAEANDTVARLKSETEAMVQRQAEQLETQIRREVVAAAAAAAEKAVREVTTPDDQKRLADAFMRELGKVAETPARNGVKRA